MLGECDYQKHGPQDCFADTLSESRFSILQLGGLVIPAEQQSRDEYELVLKVNQRVLLALATKDDDKR